MTYLPYIVAWWPYLTLGAVVLICSAVVAWLEIEAAGERMAHQAKCNHLDRLRREREAMDEQRKQYRKTIRKDFPALVRLKELGFMQACGHHPYHWNGFKGECEQCVLEGRRAARDMGRNQ